MFEGSEVWWDESASLLLICVFKLLLGLREEGMHDAH